MVNPKIKLQLAAFFVSASAIILTLCYSIFFETSITIESFALIGLVSAIIGVIISRISNPDIGNFFITILESFTGNIDNLESQVDAQQIKNKSTDEYIKQRPALHTLVIVAIIIAVILFLYFFYTQGLLLMK